MRISLILTFALMFVLGWMLNDVSNIESEQPGILSGYVISEEPIERISPNDIIAEEQIHVYSDRIVIEVDNPQWATFTDTNSMDPLIDIGSNALQIIPVDEAQIDIGDIISFEPENDSGVIIHRVVETGYDKDGWYAITKGDNNPTKDPGKIRFNQVKKLLIGIIY